MVVKSATKKRLMELGVEEDLAHKLATDRNMDDIKKMAIEEVAQAVGLGKDDDRFVNVMNVIRELSAQRRKRTSRKVTISARSYQLDDFEVGLNKFNVLNHVLVPHQELIPVDEEEEALAPWGLTEVVEETGETRLRKELLPKIHMADPVIQVIKETEEKAEMDQAGEDEDFVPRPAGWLADRVLRVVRQSPSAGVTVAYRLIVEGTKK
ncbi:MAG: DNA-directed RNA polymerase subunit RpoH/Rpb5 C-terminal domain-containing protein [Candidatus Poseidoniaceae archaeon]|jgi:DNA-directed RNA polymerase subunit H (RpoH/RPB5)|nr:DNA-directed RNA polymerase subunit RpoH/Rpb5 C-terminal domain-containing protein [Candidatus Poseidoniaceae archaeon]